MKRFIAILLCVLMIVPQAVIGSLASEVEYAVSENEAAPQSDATLIGIEVYEYNTVIEGNCGGYTDRNTETMYYHYNPYYFINTVKLSYSDGTSDVVNFSDIYDYCSIDMVQNYENQWTADNTYPITLNYNGVSCRYDVYITPTNIESIEIPETISFVEGQHLKTVSEYVDGQWVEHQEYEVFDAIVDGMIKVNYKDGTSENVRLWNDYHDLYFAFASNQSADNVWTAGNTYTATLHYYGVSCDYDVTITEDPIDYVEVYGTKSLVEGYDGSYGSISSNNVYSHYYWYSAADAIESVRIVYKDGTDKICSLWELESYSVDCDSSYEQSQEPWVAGNYYDATFNCGSHSCDFKVYIAPNGIESVEVYELGGLVVGEHSEQKMGYDNESGQWLYYDHYNVENAVKSVILTYTDGTTEIVPYQRYGYADSTFETTQSYNTPWVVDNTYPVTMLYAGRICNFEVSVISDPIVSFEVYETEAVVEGIDGWYENYWSVERGFYSWFYYPMYEAVKSVKINYTDGSYDILDYDQWRERPDSILEWTQNEDNQWLAGNTYTVKMGVKNHVIDVPVYITPNGIESIVPYNVVPLVEGTQGTQEDLVNDQWVNYPFYFVKNAFEEVLITYENGETEIRSKWDIPDNQYVTITDQRYHNQWQAGNTYTATLMCMGKTAEFSVTIEADPIESIEVIETKPIYEGADGWWRGEYSDELGQEIEFFQYYPWNAIVSVRVNYSDGTSRICSYSELRSEGNVSVNHSQSVNNQWQAGNTYTATLNLGKHSCDFEVKIDRRSIVDLEFSQFDSIIKEGSLGGWASQYVDGEWKNYFEYLVYYNIGWVTAYYSDGTSREYHFSEVDIETDQNYFNQWTGGNSYPVTITVDGYSETVYLYIEPTNIERFEILETKPIYEGDGYNDSYYDEELGDYVNYIRYDEWDALDQIKIYYKDGTSEICHYDDLGMKIGGSVYLYGNQGAPDNIWTAGNTYSAMLSCGMFDDEFEISIIENPIASIEIVETKPIEENTNGWYNSYWDENNNYGEYFFYQADAAVWAIKINYKDGTSEILNRGSWGSWSCNSVQNENNQWTVGNTYTATFKYKGHSCDFEVSIVPFTPYSYMIQDGGAYITGLKNNWYFEENSIADLVIPSEIQGYPVVGINGLSAIGGVVETITVPASVKYISDWSFSSFYNLKTIYIEGTETILSASTFYGISCIEEFVVNEAHPDYTVIDGVVFDKEVTTIVAYPLGKGATYELPVTISDFSFREIYPGVNFIVHPDSKEFVVENGITYNKDKTQIISCDKTVSGEYVMPETVEYIPEMVFQGCENLTSVVMSPLVTNIAYATFDNCPNLKSVVLPTELQSIGDCAFADCTSLESIELPSKLENIESKAFYNAGLKNLTIPGNVGYVGSYSFANAQLVTLTTEDATEEYGLYFAQSAFENNVNLTTAELGEGLTGISSYAFAYCENLAEINIPDSTTMFGEYIFQSCDALTYLPIGANQDHIPTGEFYDCDGLADVTIPNQVVAILTNAFRECSNLKTVQMPDELTYLERYIFAGCTSLTELPLSANQTYIAYGEFSGCTGLVNIELPERITEICAYAFNNCTNLESINLSDDISYIDRGAFQGCTSLKEAYIGNKMESIEMYTFKNSGITEVVIGENVQSIKYEAFMSSKLKSVDIPANVTYIAYFAFFGCEDLAEINMPDTLVELGGHSFGATKWYNNKREGMVYLGTSLYNYKGDIPEGTELYVKPGTLAIAGHAFESGCSDSWYWGYKNDERYLNELYDRSGLKAIHIPEGVEVIGDHAFYNCSGLTEVYLPASLTSIYIEAFCGADNIETIYYGGSEEQWYNITIFDGHSIFDGCEVIFNYVDDTYPEEPEVEIGDIDGNGNINSVDLFKMNLFVKQIVSPTDEEAVAADIDGNDKVNSVDMFYLKYRILKGEWSIK